MNQPPQPYLDEIARQADDPPSRTSLAVRVWPFWLNAVSAALAARGYRLMHVDSDRDGDKGRDLIYETVWTREPAADQRLTREDWLATITPEEVHALCHNLPATVSRADFEAGCRAYQDELYGPAAAVAEDKHRG